MMSSKREISEVKKELNSYIYDKELIAEKEKELEYLMTKATKITTEATTIKATSPLKDKIGEYAAKIADLKNEKYSCLIEMHNKKEKIEKNIDKLEQPFRNILYFKYIKNYTLEKIADILKYNYEHTCRLHGQALIKYKDVNKNQ